MVFLLWVSFVAEKAMAPHSSTLAWKFHGRRSLVGCSPWGRKEPDTTERLHFHFSLSHIGKGNGNPLHCSCLENPRDGGAWWAAVCGVAQSWTRLKWLSSSSSLVDNYRPTPVWCAFCYTVEPPVVDAAAAPWIRLASHSVTQRTTASQGLQ